MIVIADTSVCILMLIILKCQWLLNRLSSIPGYIHVTVVSRLYFDFIWGIKPVLMRIAWEGFCEFTGTRDRGLVISVLECF